MQRGSSRSDHGSRVRRLALTSVIESSTAVLAGQTLTQKVAAVPAASELVASSRQANPIPAWTEFCKRYPTECTVDHSQPAIITLTAGTWSTILEVNRRVNKSVRSLPDRDHWGVADRWDLAEDGLGDCEDFQLLKRKLLAEAGLPRRAMRMTVVIDDRMKVMPF